MFKCWVVIHHLLDDGAEVVAVYASEDSAYDFWRKSEPAYGYYEVVEKELRD